MVFEVEVEVGENGEIKIPKQIRELSGIESGSKAKIQVKDNKIVISNKSEGILEDFVSEILKREEPEKVDPESKYTKQIQKQK